MKSNRRGAASGSARHYGAEGGDGGGRGVSDPTSCSAEPLERSGPTKVPLCIRL